MNRMFMGAKLFKQQLHGAAWVRSDANNNLMFEGSSGSIARKVSTFAPKRGIRTSRVFSLQSLASLKSAVRECFKLSIKGDCSLGPHGAIGEWNVSKVANMSGVFEKAAQFNADISKWDVSMGYEQHVFERKIVQR